jgi:hypothetical protein
MSQGVIAYKWLQSSKALGLELFVFEDILLREARIARLAHIRGQGGKGGMRARGYEGKRTRRGEQSPTSSSSGV